MSRQKIVSSNQDNNNPRGGREIEPEIAKQRNETSTEKGGGGRGGGGGGDVGGRVVGAGNEQFQFQILNDVYFPLGTKSVDISHKLTRISTH